MAADLMAEIAEEMTSADLIYGPFTSTHEAYGVLAEEVAELLEAIRKAKRGPHLEPVREEAIQVAAVAARLARCCRDHRAFATRSGAA